MIARKYDLEDRLVEFSSGIIDIVESMPSTRAGNYLAEQFNSLWSCSGLTYGEAQSAESRDDFIHKMKIGLKERNPDMFETLSSRRK
jgi:hypothetical protein